MFENPNTRAALIGHPVKHSRSPQIHNHWLAETGIDGNYEALDISPDALENFCAWVSTSQLKGFNVTIPHKETIMAFCDEIDETARTIGAVNTVCIQEGRLIGHNTDAYGFLENLKQGVPDFDMKSVPAVVLGAGGAARAVLHALTEASIPYVTLCNRTRERAESLALDFRGISVADWSQRHDILVEASLIVNTTALGMSGQDPLDLDLRSLSTRAVVYDLIYNPLQTDLLKNAAQRGCIAIGGLGMLVYQAQKAFSLWFGQTPVVSEALMQTIRKSL
jgi:shikimate dehydrogenase